MNIPPITGRRREHPLQEQILDIGDCGEGDSCCCHLESRAWLSGAWGSYMLDRLLDQWYNRHACLVR